MKRKLHQIATVVSFCSVAVLLSSCSGGGSSSSSNSNSTGLYGGKTSQATIDTQSVKDTLASVKDIFPSCTATGVSKAAVKVQPDGALAVIKSVQRMLPPRTAKKTGKSTALISSTAPASKSGDCGGTLSYPTYSHSSGTTTMSVKWDNYCTTDTSGNTTTYNGTLSAVDAGTPTASGPVTTKLTANIPSLSIVEKNSGGTILSNETIALDSFEYVPTAGASSSDLSGTVKFTSFETKDIKNNNEYKLENVNLSTGKVGTDTQLSFSGRIYRGKSGYSDLTTDTPLVVDADQNLKSGQISFTGAGGHKATLTVASGTGQTFTVQVDGTQLTGAQLSCSGL